jgi:hypothetical protein
VSAGQRRGGRAQLFEAAAGAGCHDRLPPEGAGDRNENQAGCACCWLHARSLPTVGSHPGSAALCLPMRPAPSDKQGLTEACVVRLVCPLWAVHSLWNGLLRLLLRLARRRRPRNQLHRTCCATRPATLVRAAYLPRGCCHESNGMPLHAISSPNSVTPPSLSLCNEQITAQDTRSVYLTLI